MCRRSCGRGHAYQHRRGGTGARGGWEKTRVSGNEAIDGYDVTVDANGTTNVIWAGEGGDGPRQAVRVRTRAADGSWSEPQVLAEKASGFDDFQEPVIAATAAGGAAAAWIDASGSTPRIMARVKPAGGSWGAAEQVANAKGISQLRIAGAASGHVMLVWRQDDGIHASRYTPANGWSAPRTLSSSGANPDVAINDTGVAYAAWSQKSNSSAPDRIRARYSTPGGAWSTFATLSSSDRRADEPAVAVDQNGSGMVVWSQRRAPAVIQEAHRPVGSTWTKTVTISNTKRTSIEPDVVLDARGSAVAVWQVRLAGGDTWSYEVDANSRPSGGKWGTARRLDVEAMNPMVGMDGQGNATAVWHKDGYYPCGLVAAEKPAGKSWAVPKQVANGIDTWSKEYAVGADGTAAAVIYDHNGQDGDWDHPIYAFVRP